MEDVSLAELRVRDIRHLFVDEPSRVEPAVPLREVMEKMIADLRTRGVYVADDKRRVIGAISMYSIVEYLFPLGAIIEHALPLYETYVPKLGARGAGSHAFGNAAIDRGHHTGGNGRLALSKGSQ